MELTAIFISFLSIILRLHSKRFNYVNLATWLKHNLDSGLLPYE